MIWQHYINKTQIAFWDVFLSPNRSNERFWLSVQCFRPPSIYLCSIIQSINSDDELQSIENQIAQLNPNRLLDRYIKSKHPTIMAQPTAYVFRSAEDTLTFCYDAACATRNGDTWEIPEVIEYLSDVEWQDEAIQKVIIEPSFADYRPTSTVGWFGNLKKLTIIEGIEHLNTSCVTDMTSMFRACTSLTSLALYHFDTS